MKPAILVAVLLCTFAFAFSQTLNNPESIVLDYSSTYTYVSNAGNGQILRKAFMGNYGVFASGLGSVRGLFIDNNILYAACNLGLARYNIITGWSIGTVQIPGAVYLNDVVADSSGNIYVSDSQAHKIFRYNISSEVVSTFISTGVQNPNGMAFDASLNRILLVSYRANSPIQSIQLPNGEVSTLITTTIGNLDGIGIDYNAAIYFSSWQTSSLYRMSTVNSAPVAFWTGLSGPADFFIYARNTDQYPPYNFTNSIFVPLFNTNSTTSYPVPNIITQFNAIAAAGGPYPTHNTVQWLTYYELDALGYNLYYCFDYESPVFENATLVNTTLIAAQNTLWAIYNLEVNQAYGYWWLEILEQEGTNHLYGPSHAEIVANEDDVQTPVIRQMQIYPNPVSANSVLSIELSKPERIAIVFYDIKGRQVWKTTTGFLNIGKNDISLSSIGFDATSLPSGIYLCRVGADGQFVERKIVIKR